MRNWLQSDFKHVFTYNSPTSENGIYLHLVLDIYSRISTSWHIGAGTIYQQSDWLNRSLEEKEEEGEVNLIG